MDKMILTDKTEVVIKEGASLNNITTEVESFEALGNVAEALKKEGNLGIVQFLSGENVVGNYSDMVLESPLFREVDKQGETVTAVFALREKTNVEKRLDALEAGKSIQDGAIEDLGNVVSELSEGGSL
ncbi:MAG: hypothetical protein ACLUEC_10530 [Coprococcus sp.]